MANLSSLESQYGVLGNMDGPQRAAHLLQPQEKGKTRLLISVDADSREEVRYLLAHGAGTQLHASDAHGFTPLAAAARFSSLDLVVDLLRAGAGAEIQKYPLSSQITTPVHYFLKSPCSPGDTVPRLGVLALMLALGERAWADLFALPLWEARRRFININPFRGDTFLHSAAERHAISTPLLQTLLLNGADPTVPNSAAKTPLHFLEATAQLLATDAPVNPALASLFSLPSLDGPSRRLAIAAWSSLPLDCVPPFSTPMSPLPSSRPSLVLLAEALRLISDPLAGSLDILSSPSRTLLVAALVSCSSSPYSSTSSTSSTSSSFNSPRDHMRRQLSMPAGSLYDQAALHAKPPRAPHSDRLPRHSPSIASTAPLTSPQLPRHQSNPIDSPVDDLDRSAADASDPLPSSSLPDPCSRDTGTPCLVFVCPDILLVCMLPPDICMPLRALSGDDPDLPSFLAELPMACLPCPMVLSLEHIHLFDLPDSPPHLQDSIQIVHLPADPSHYYSWTLSAESSASKILLWKSIIQFQIRPQAHFAPKSPVTNLILDDTTVICKHLFLDSWTRYDARLSSDRLEFFAFPRQPLDAPVSVLFIGLEPYYLADVDTQDQIIQLTKPDQREHYQLHFPSPLSFSSWLSQLQQIFSAR